MGINKQELIGKIHGIEGLSNDEKSALIELLRTHKKYGLVWEDKPENVEERLREELPVLTEVKERAIISKDPEAPNHILIEGDNLEALTALTYTHAGKIDVIYIDPPYNTGNKDFIYNDSYVDKEDAFRHSKWLSFMSKRLVIAKKLLSDQGVIFVSIDDNEQANLKLICDEIFLRTNFIGCIPRLTSPQRFAQEKNINISHDYVLVYRKCDLVELRKVRNSVTDKELKSDAIGHYYDGDTKALIAPISQGYSANCDYDFEYNGRIYKPINKNGVRNRWFWTKTRMEAAARLGILRETKTTIRMQIYQDVKFDENTNTMVPKETGLRFCSLDLIDNQYSNPNGVSDLSNVGSFIFNNPKPLSLLETILELYPSETATVLDFFAGSGTTLHATIKYNEENGGHRRCILITNNENNICEDVTYERNKRVIEGYTKPNGEEVDGLTHNTLRYYKTDFVGRERSSQNMRQLVYAATDLLCIKEDLYTEVKQFGSLKLKSSVARYFEGKDKRMLVIYNELAVPTIADEIAKMDFSGKVKIYVFAPGNYAYDDEFFEVQNKVELCALPAAIYNAYQKVLPKRKTKLLDGVQEETEQVENNGELNLNFGEE
ncbi:MAG: site-specific DNA-methyltransferase [Candidatus Cryptobacteroides sp.]|nr:site-specific DNA-methyltransferase [Candidatus Cryptobacteroides sp.]